jgi:hypothetical protein
MQNSWGSILLGGELALNGGDHAFVGIPHSNPRHFHLWAIVQMGYCLKRGFGLSCDQKGFEKENYAHPPHNARRLHALGRFVHSFKIIFELFPLGGIGSHLMFRRSVGGNSGFQSLGWRR